MSRRVCPHCGEDLSPRAKACRECGSDFETGWNDEVDYLSVELPDPDESRPGGAGPFARVLLLVVAFTLLGPVGFLGARWLWRQPTGPELVVFLGIVGGLWLARELHRRLRPS